MQAMDSIELDQLARVGSREGELLSSFLLFLSLSLHLARQLICSCLERRDGEREREREGKIPASLHDMRLRGDVREDGKRDRAFER